MTTVGNLTAHARFLRKKPLVIPRAMKGFYRTLFLGQKVLRTIDWAVTYRCNARCVMCSARRLYNSEREELTLEQRKMVWKQALKLGAIHTQFTGGEPMVKGIDWIEQAIRDLQPEKVLVCMSTNAMLLDKEKIRRMHDAGLDTLQMSIDSLVPDEHNRLRGLSGNFQHIMKMFRYARDVGLNAGLGSVLAPTNSEMIKKLAAFTKSEGVHCAVNRVSNPENWVSDDYRSWSIEEYPKYKEVLDIPNVRTDTFLNFNGRSGCPAGERIEITAYGDVMSCPQVQISFGNVLEEPLKVIWERLYNSPLFKYRCGECRWCWDSKFYETYIKPYEKFKQMPVPIEKVMEDMKKRGKKLYAPNFCIKGNKLVRK